MFIYVMYVVCDSCDHILTLKKMECQCLYIVVCDSRDHIKMTEEKPFEEFQIYFTHSGSMYITHSFNLINRPPTPTHSDCFSNVIGISKRNYHKVSKKRKRVSK